MQNIRLICNLQALRCSMAHEQRGDSKSARSARHPLKAIHKTRHQPVQREALLTSTDAAVQRSPVVWWTGSDARQLSFVAKSRPDLKLRMKTVESLSPWHLDMQIPDVLVVSLSAHLTRREMHSRLASLESVMHFRADLPVIVLSEKQSLGSTFANPNVHSFLTLPVDEHLLTSCIEHAVVAGGRALDNVPRLQRDSRSVCVDGQAICFTHAEMRLIEALWSRPFALVSYEDLGRALFGAYAKGYVDAHDGVQRVYRLVRSKLAQSSMGHALERLPRRGFRWVAPVQEPKNELKILPGMAAPPPRGQALWFAGPIGVRPEHRAAITGAGYELMELQQAESLKSRTGDLKLAIIDTQHPEAKIVAHWLRNKRPTVAMVLVQPSAKVSEQADPIQWPMGPTVVLHEDVSPEQLQAWAQWGFELRGRYLTLPMQGQAALHLEPRERLVMNFGESIRLPSVPFSILSALARYPNRALPLHQLMTMVWGSANSVTQRALYVRVCELRRYLDRMRHPKRPRIETVRHVGYRLVVEGHE